MLVLSPAGLFCATIFTPFHSVMRRSRRAFPPRTALRTAFLLMASFAGAAAAQTVSTRMIPNTGGSRCVIASDVNALVFNQSQGFGIGLSPYFTPEDAAKRLDNCLRRKGVRKEHGVDLGTEERRRIFCRCNEEITDTKNLICESGSYSEGSQFSRSDCSKLATALQKGGIGILNVCLPPPLMMLGHAVTVTKIVCDEANGGAQISYIDSNELSKGVVNTEITSGGKLLKAPSIPIGEFKWSTDAVCGFITKTPPHSSDIDPAALEE